MASDVRMIVVTGGPCAGKTTAMSWLREDLQRRGWVVLFASEVATELITGGVAPWTCASIPSFQHSVFELQLGKERAYLSAARAMEAERVMVVCDRGLPDCRSYLTREEYQAILDDFGMTEAQARDRYDAVFHLVTAAKEAPEFYTLANNQARRETIEEAAALDDRLIAAWEGHPQLRVIGAFAAFDEKMLRLMREVDAFLG